MMISIFFTLVIYQFVFVRRWLLELLLYIGDILIVFLQNRRGKVKNKREEEKSWLSITLTILAPTADCIIFSFLNTDYQTS